MTAQPVPVIFIHGLWIHSDAGQPWVELYRSVGYKAIAPGWPGDSDSVDKTRKNAAAVADKGHSGRSRHLGTAGQPGPADRGADAGGRGERDP